MKESILFHSDVVEIGVFEISPTSPCFLQSGFIEAPIIVFPKKSIWIQHEGSAPFVADSSIVNFYNKGQIYNRSAIDQSGDYCHWFRLSSQILSEVMANEKCHFSFENLPCSSQMFLLHLVTLQKVMVKPQVNVLEVEEHVMMLFHELLSAPQKHDHLFNKNYKRHKRLIERVKESIQSDLSVNLSLQQLSKLHNTSPYHLSRVFKAITGQGINRYRTQQRLHALTLELQQHQVDLVGLSFDYGFSSHSHMSASYKQVFGVTPSECQKQIVY